MGRISSLLGGGVTGDAVAGTAAPIAAIGHAIDSIFTSDDERLTHDEIRARIEQAPALAQVELTRQEATHRSIFVAGWRPAIGWICAFSIGYAFLFRELFVWGLKLYDPTIEPPPAIQSAELLNLTLGMLGLGGLRTWEKVKGVSSDAPVGATPPIAPPKPERSRRRWFGGKR